MQTSGKSLSGAHRGEEECTPSGYVDSVPSKDHFSSYCGASLHLQAAGRTLCGAYVLRTRVGNIRLFSSCVVH